MSLPNKEAAAYAIFSHFHKSGRAIGRDEAFAILDEIIDIVPSVAKILDRPWRRRRPTAAAGVRDTAVK